MPQTGGPTNTPKPKPKVPAVKVYVKPEARKPIQASLAVNFINQQVGRQVVKLTADKDRAQIAITRGLNEGGGGYTYGQPSTAKQVLEGAMTHIKVDPRAGANSEAGWEGSKPVRKRTDPQKFQETGLLGGYLNSAHPAFSPTIAQTTAHEITHALGETHRIGWHMVNGQWYKNEGGLNDNPHIMNWSSNTYSEAEVQNIKRKTNPKNIGKPGNRKKPRTKSRKSSHQR